MTRPGTRHLLSVASFVLVMAAVCPASATPQWESMVRAALAEHLEPDEVERLMRSRYAGASLDELFEGWDGQSDSLKVERTRDGVVLHTVIRNRHCWSRLQRPEAPIEQPTCEDKVQAQRTVTFAPDTYTPPKRPKPAPIVVADASTKDVTPPKPSVLEKTGVAHTPDEKDKPLDEVAQARVDHETLRDRAKRPGYKDPMLPKDPIEAGEALTPLDWEPIVESATSYHLKNPFDEARMRTHLPMPNEAITGLGTSLDAPPPVPARRPECDAMWDRRDLSSDPPTLDCYRRVAFNNRLDKKPLHKALGPLASIISLPVLDWLMAQEVQEAIDGRSHGPVWAMTWLAWVKQNASRTDEALAKLTPEERRLLRRRLADWWGDKLLAEWHPTITGLFERHFVALYPEARDTDGLPRRAFLTDTWLWVNNWFAGVDARGEDAIVEAYEHLPSQERKLITAFVRDGSLRDKFTRAFGVIASL